MRGRIRRAGDVVAPRKKGALRCRCGTRCAGQAIRADDTWGHVETERIGLARRSGQSADDKVAASEHESHRHLVA